MSDEQTPEAVEKRRAYTVEWLQRKKHYITTYGRTPYGDVAFRELHSDDLDPDNHEVQSLRAKYPKWTRKWTKR